jgi:hypothetical protein
MQGTALWNNPQAWESIPKSFFMKSFMILLRYATLGAFIGFVKELFHRFLEYLSHRIPGKRFYKNNLFGTFPVVKVRSAVALNNRGCNLFSCALSLLC